MSRRTVRTAGALTVAAALTCLGGSVSASNSTNGTLVVTGTVMIVSGIATGAVSGRVTVVMEAGHTGDINQYIISVPVTLMWTGNSGTGTVTIPYSWAYESGSIDSVQINFAVSANLASEPSARTSVIIQIPASGSQTTLSLPTAI